MVLFCFAHPSCDSCFSGVFCCLVIVFQAIATVGTALVVHCYFHAENEERKKEKRNQTQQSEKDDEYDMPLWLHVLTRHFLIYLLHYSNKKCNRRYCKWRKRERVSRVTFISNVNV